MQLREITSRLKGVKGGGRQYTALCPAHADKNPSLSISEQDGKVLLHCHAGCTTENILSAIGLEMKDLFTEDRVLSINTNNKPKREIARVYDYKDLDGNIMHSTIRYNPKSFSQRRPDPDKPGEYIWKEVFKGITPILYNLQAVTQAVSDKQPVFIVEGEKDCETLEDMDYVATTCPMGAGKWRNEYSETLKGATVYIIADIDETGKKHAEIVAKFLVGKAREVYLIDLIKAKPEAMTNIPQGWDITDLIEATPLWQRIAVVDDLIANSTLCYSNDESEGCESSPNGKKNAAEQLIQLVESSGAGFFHSDVKDLYATIQMENHVEVLPINSRDFELWLNGLFYRHTGKPISKDGVKQVLAVLSSKALFDNPNPITLSTRIAEHEEAFWYDLSNSNWQAVKIDNSGWEIIDNPPILFSRYRHQLQQTLPKHGANINKMLDYINIKESRTLFLCWLVSCFIPNIPHAAIIIHGEKGAAKSTASGLLKSLIDPSALDQYHLA